MTKNRCLKATCVVPGCTLNIFDSTCLFVHGELTSFDFLSQKTDYCMVGQNISGNQETYMYTPEIGHLFLLHHTPLTRTTYRHENLCVASQCAVTPLLLLQLAFLLVNQLHLLVVDVFST